MVITSPASAVHARFNAAFSALGADRVEAVGPNRLALRFDPSRTVQRSVADAILRDAVDGVELVMSPTHRCPGAPVGLDQALTALRSLPGVAEVAHLDAAQQISLFTRTVEDRDSLRELLETSVLGNDVTVDVASTFTPAI